MAEKQNYWQKFCLICWLNQQKTESVFYLKIFWLLTNDFLWLLAHLANGRWKKWGTKKLGFSNYNHIHMCRKSLNRVCIILRNCFIIQTFIWILFTLGRRQKKKSNLLYSFLINSIFHERKAGEIDENKTSLYFF